MKARFTVGDTIVAITNKYGVTSTDNEWKGTVVKVGSPISKHDIYVKTLSAKDPADINDNILKVPSKDFALDGRKMQVFSDEVSVSSPKKRKKRRSKYGAIGSGNTLLQIAKSFKVEPRKAIKKAPKEDQELDLAIAWAQGEVSITQVSKAIGMKHIGHSTYMWLLNTLKRHFKN